MWHKLSPLASHFELRVSVYGLLEHIQSFEIWGEILSSNRCNMLLCLATFTSYVCMATELKSLDTSRFWETRICLVYNLTWRSMARATSLMVLAKWWRFWTPRMIHYGKCMLIARSAPLGWLAPIGFIRISPKKLLILMLWWRSQWFMVFRALAAVVMTLWVHLWEHRLFHYPSRPVKAKLLPWEFLLLLLHLVTSSAWSQDPLGDRKMSQQFPDSWL